MKNTGFRIFIGSNLLLIGLFVRIPLLAQPAPDTIHIPEVSILGHGNVASELYSYTELDSFALKQSALTSLSELLNKHSTIYIKSTGRGTLSTASFRGTGAGHTKICWNGLILNSSMLGQTDLSLIPSVFLDNISLFHGGSSLTTCPGALGGIVALDNTPAWNNKSSFTLINELASFGTYQTFGKLEVKKNKWILKSRAFYNYSENNYSYYNQNILPPENQRLHNSQYSGYGYLQELYYRTLKKDMFSIKLWLQHSDRNLPPPLSREESEVRESQIDGSIRSVINWKHYGRKGEYEINSGIISDRIGYTLAQSSDGNLSIDSRSRENSFINRFEYKQEINPGTISRLQVLYNYYKVGILEHIRSEGYKASRSELSLMAELDKEFGTRIRTFMLIRTNLVDKDFIPVMPSLGFTVKLLNRLELYLKTNMSRNYNVPRLNDLYWIPGGNPDLLPEESYTADIAMDFRMKNDIFILNSVITGYFSRMNNWIIWKPTLYQYWAPENVALVHSRGLEFSIKTTTYFNLTWIIVQASYNLCKTTGSDSRQLMYIPVHNLSTWCGVVYKGYHLTVQASYTGKRLTQTDALKPYFLGDVSASKEFNLQKFRMNFSFSVRNLFNEDYQVVLARPMPGRNYSLMLGLSF